MERGSSSRRTWADEIEEKELAAASTAASPGLNPEVAPFFPAGKSPAGSGYDYGGRLSFTDSEASEGSDYSEHGSPRPPGRERKSPRRARAAAANVVADGGGTQGTSWLPPVALRPGRATTRVEVRVRAGMRGSADAAPRQ
jgi:hypothetical protein